MNKVYLNINGSTNRVIQKCIDNNISLYDVNYLGPDEANVLISLNDYKKIKRLCYFSKIRIIKYQGTIGIKKHFKDNIYFYVLFFLCFILMDILTSYIIKIDIIHENTKIRKLVQEELKVHGIDKFSLAYSFEELEKIKDEILKDNPTTLEWMSITRKGMTYIVRIEERIIKTPTKEDGFRHVIAGKDALITKIMSTKGEVLVRSGDYVKKGDTLISGKIMLYENVMGNTLATGTVYGDVWYETTIKIPKNKTYYEDTGKSRYNLNINDKIFLKNKYHLFRMENIKELNILGIKIKIYKEVEYKKYDKKLSDKELDIERENKIQEAFAQKLKSIGKIISQKVLKKEENNSTIIYRVFVVTNEIISSYSYYEEGEENDTTSSN